MLARSAGSPASPPYCDCRPIMVGRPSQANAMLRMVHGSYPTSREVISDQILRCERHEQMIRWEKSNYRTLFLHAITVARSHRATDTEFSEHRGTMIDFHPLLSAFQTVRRELLALRDPTGHWVGELSSSAFATASAASALCLVARAVTEESRREAYQQLACRSVDWLVAGQNSDGGWGDTRWQPFEPGCHDAGPRGHSPGRPVAALCRFARPGAALVRRPRRTGRVAAAVRRRSDDAGGHPRQLGPGRADRLARRAGDGLRACLAARGPCNARWGPRPATRTRCGSASDKPDSSTAGRAIRWPC